ncbi:MAG: membrane protein insertion efficiency factor YidD [Deltaproteobacteria bacterium]|nr:membrane protein insertion efficiency factor YidD [Deltaproteobacteria bacterium]
MNLMNIFRFLSVLLIDIYIYCISPLFPPRCRFYPSCSSYARESFLKHGFLRGCLLSTKRICRCHPYNSGGYDPVPPFINRL